MALSAHDRDNRNARGLATARALERAAIALASEHGVETVTVDQICAAVGVSQRTFFNHFDTKEDALLGRDLPRINERRAREYLSDPHVGILTGALGIVEPPEELVTDPETALARLRMLNTSPALAHRQAERFAPIASEVQEIIALKLSGVAGPEITPDRVRSAAHLVGTIAAALVVRAAPGSPLSELPSIGSASAQLSDLDWVWSRLL